MHWNMVRTLFIIWLLYFICNGSRLLLAGTFMGLDPGVSKKHDADLVLGACHREAVKGIKYDYLPHESDTRLISVKCNPRTHIIESIEIYPKDQYPKSQYQIWFNLGSPSSSIKDTTGHLVEYYLPMGISLHFDGADDSSPVKMFSHVDPDLLKRKPADYYINAADEACKKGEWKKAIRILEEGLDNYPDRSDLWKQRAKFYLDCSREPSHVRKEKLLESALTAYKVKETASNAVDLGWVYQQFYEDYRSAIFYYRKGEPVSKRRPELLYYMAQCYEALKELDNAAAYYKRFLLAAPNDNKASVAKRRLSALQKR